jgi:hypothetical protein
LQRSVEATQAQERRCKEQEATVEAANAEIERLKAEAAATAAAHEDNRVAETAAAAVAAAAAVDPDSAGTSRHGSPSPTAPDQSPPSLQVAEPSAPPAAAAAAATPAPIAVDGDATATLRAAVEDEQARRLAAEAQVSQLSREVDRLVAELAEAAKTVQELLEQQAAAAAAAAPSAATVGSPTKPVDDDGSVTVGGHRVEHADDMSVEQVAVLLRHDNICLEDENAALRDVVDQLVNERGESRHTLQHVMGQLEAVQKQLHAERDERDTIVQTKSRDVEELYSGILLSKQDELDAANVKLRMLEGTVADLQRSFAAQQRGLSATAAGAAGSAPRTRYYDTTAGAANRGDMGHSAASYRDGHAGSASSMSASAMAAGAGGNQHGMLEDTRRALGYGAPASPAPPQQRGHMTIGPASSAAAAPGQRSGSSLDPTFAPSSSSKYPGVRYIPADLRSSILDDV